MSIPPIRIERCDACKGTGNEERHIMPDHDSTAEFPKRVLIACKRCGGRGFHRKSK